jgi:hypothetical protein
MILLHRPRSPVEHHLEWWTDVMTAVDGTEQRVALRRRPRQRLVYDLIIPTVEEARTLRAGLVASYHEEHELPLWHEAMPLTAAAASAQAVLAVDASLNDLDAGDPVLVIDRDGTHESGEVASRTDASVTLVDNLANAYPRGALLMPLEPALIQAEPTIGDFRANASRLVVQATLTRHPAITGRGGAAPAYLDHRPLHEPALVEETLDRGVVDIDNGHAIHRVVHQLHAQVMRSRRTYSIKRPQGWQTWRLRLATLLGQQGVMLVPTWRSDLRIESATASSITVPSAQWTPHVDRVAHLLVGGELMEVTDSTDNVDGTHTIDLDGDPTGAEVVSLVETVRLGADLVMVEHHSTHSRVTVALRTVVEAA